MANLPTFKSKKDIEEAAFAIAGLMESWGIREREWMLGKQMSLFFNGTINDPKKLIRDTTVYVLSDGLPWKCIAEGRGIFPPKSSRYAKEYYRVQKKQQIGIDLMPIPNPHLKKAYVAEDQLVISILGRRIPFETTEKFVTRLIILSNYFKRKPVEELREFYFADKKRYEDRLQLYSFVQAGISSSSLKRKMKKVASDYILLMRRAYPELFKSSEQSLPEENLKGKTVFFKTDMLTGRVVVYNAHAKYTRSKDKPIFVFSHFYPTDTRVLPLAKAIVTEGGGLLSHAAIVCREARVPCLVDVKGATSVLKSGREITLDFNQGTVKI